MPIAPDPVFPDFPFRSHLKRLDSLAAATESALGDLWDLYLDGMQLLYDIYAAAATRMAIPYEDRKAAAMATTTQAVTALTSAGLLLTRGDSVRSIVCSRQGLEELLHFYACLNIDGFAKRYLEGETPRPVDVRKAIDAQPMIRTTYSWLSKLAHGSIESAQLMSHEGWMPLQSGVVDNEGARVATMVAVHVTAMGLPLIASGFGHSSQAWHLTWLERHAAYMAVWRARISDWTVSIEREYGAGESEPQPE